MDHLGSDERALLDEVEPDRRLDRYDRGEFADLEISTFKYPDIRVDTEDVDEPNILYRLQWLQGAAAEDPWRSVPFEHMQANGIGTRTGSMS